jgi:SAM-dependent methyltransferase
MHRPFLLPGPFRPGHGSNRMHGEGDVSGAREYFIRHRPSNLAHLLHQRFFWMNEYIPPGTRALELGCGAAFSQFFIAQPIALSDVEHRPWVDRVEDALNLDIPDDSFDVIICSHMIHHLAKPLQFFERVSRVLKPGGRLLINEINTALLMRLLLRIMNHEGWSYEVDIFDPDAIANDPNDPWSANCAIPQLLFDDLAAFEARAPFFRVERHELTECLVFPLSGGVIAKTRTVNLPETMLRAVDILDTILIKLMPGVFAMARRVVLQRVA